MLFVEINEFSPALMAKAAALIDGRNLRRLLDLNHSRTTAIEKEERFGLDPWVQWVSIHTGLPAASHKVAHLGDVPDLRFRQIWEILDGRGVRCGVWGAMNASRGSSKAAFFFPDPWTFSERAYPEELNLLLGLPRYFSKNYGDLNALEMIKQFVKLAAFCLRPAVLRTLAPLLPTLCKHVIKHGMSEYLLFVLFDLVNTKLYLQYCRRHDTDFSLLFLNSLAHLQHHKWTEDEGLSTEMVVSFRLFDQLLGYIFALADERNSPIVFANAFSQRRSYDDYEFLYRQKNPAVFLRTLGVNFTGLEQAMTNDGHVFFESQERLDEAADILVSARIGDQVAFHVDLANRHENRFFFQFIVWRKINPGAVLSVGSRQFDFFDLFEEVTRRSAVHVQDGDVFARGFPLPPQLVNYELYHHILKYFDAEPGAARRDRPGNQSLVAST